MRGVVAVAILAIGCYHPNATTGAPCSSTGQCPEGQQCDMSMSPPTCSAGSAGVDASTDPDAIDAAIGCTGPGSCPDTAPICDQGTQQCRGCRADAECPSSGVCVESQGTCAAASEAIWVSPSGMDAGTCTQMAPCATFAYAFGQVAPGHEIVRVGDGSYAEQVSIPSVLPGNQAIILSGEDEDAVGATFTPMTGVLGPAIQANGNAVIEGITILDAPSDAIDANLTTTLYQVRIRDCGSRGVYFKGNNGSSLHVLDSEIEGCHNDGMVSMQGAVELQRVLVAQNTGGGVSFQRGQITIVNSMIVANVSTSGNGGLVLKNLNGYVPVMRYDTIAGNSNASGSTNAAGLQSDQPFMLEASIIAGNGIDPTREISSEISSIYCLFADLSAAPAGVGNKVGAAAFTANYRIGDTSAARDGATGATVVPIDFDGDPRPQGSGTDIGADEIP